MPSLRGGKKKKRVWIEISEGRLSQNVGEVKE
jgi:hypothetical protein